MSKLSQHFKNALKGATVMVGASLVFSILLSIFPLIGSIIVSEFSLKSVLSQNFDLFLLIAGTGIPIGIMVGIITPAIKQKRLFFLTLTGLIAYWLLIIIILLFSTGFKISTSDLGNVFLLSIWAMLAYSVFAIPVLALVIFLVERWTRKK